MCVIMFVYSVPTSIYMYNTRSGHEQSTNPEYQAAGVARFFVELPCWDCPVLSAIGGGINYNIRIINPGSAQDSDPESEPDLTPATAAAHGIGLDSGRNLTCDYAGRFPLRIRIQSRRLPRVT